MFPRLMKMANLSYKNLFGVLLAVLFLSQGVYAYANPAVVVLGAAGNYVALAETTITTTGTTAVVGDIGISPNGGSSLVGFAQIMDSSGQFSKSALVTGNIYASNYATPTPSNLGTAITNMGTAYTDANGRTADETNLVLHGPASGNLGGLTLTHGVYAFNGAQGDVTIDGGDLTLSGGPDDVWIFKVEKTLTCSQALTPRHVILTGGAQAKNVFWVVAGQTTLFPGCVFNGIILDQTGIAMQNGATFNGRALAQTAITLIGNSVLLPVVPVSLPNSTSNITNCMLINSSGAYRMINDLSGAPIDASPLSNTACVKITSSNVILDCNNFRITNNGTGATTYGILLTNTSNNVTVINCPRISQYSYGVEVYNSNNSAFNNIITSNNSVNGFSVNASAGTNVTNSAAFGNGAAFTFTSTVGGTNTLANMSAHDNTGDAFKFAATGPNTLTNCLAVSNTGSAFFFNISGTVTLTGNTADNNHDAFTIISGPIADVFTNNVAFNQATTGTSIINSSVNLINHHYYNNNPDMSINSTTGTNSLLLSGVIFDSPAGGFSSYTNLSLSDVAVFPAYTIKWSAQPAPLPAGTTSFNGKFVNISDIPLPVIDSITWSWSDSELGLFNESNFQLWMYNSTNWTLLNSTPDTVGNTLGLSNVASWGVYAILMNGTLPVVTPP
jgi:hypothetical protein